MTDNFIFATTIEDAPTAESGFDGLPFPIKYGYDPVLIGPGTYYPLGLTLGQLCRLYWGINRWRVQAFEATPFGDVNLDNNFPNQRQGTTFTPPVDGVTAARDLLTIRQQGTINANLTWDPGDFFPYGVGLFEAKPADVDWPFYPHKVVEKDGLFYPSAYVPGQYIKGGLATGEAALTSASVNPFSFYFETGNSRNWGMDTNVTMTPWGWWPWENSTGLPIYNTATGIAIRDPRS